VRRALDAYLRRLWADGDAEAAVLAAAEAEAGDPWAIVANAGLLARCRVEVAERDLCLGPALRLAREGVAVPEGAPYPVPIHAARRRRGAYDTPADLARRIVASAKAAAGEVRTALDPACGTGAFLVALLEAGVPEVHGTDLDPLAVRVARLAAPGAQVEVGDALSAGPTHDLVVGNPPFVPPERQDKALRTHLRQRFPWLRGRFDLAVPFAAVAVRRCRSGGVVGLVLPAAVLSQPYGAPLRRRWVEGHRLVEIGGPWPFPGASVDVVSVVLVPGGGPAALPSGVRHEEVLSLPNVPLDPDLRPGDADLVHRVRDRSLRLGDLAHVDTGVVAHQPGGSREALLHDTPGEGRVPYADAREFFAGRHRWLEYRPERMHRAKRPAMFEVPKIVVQRIRGGGVARAAVDRAGIYVGHTCTVVVPHPPERIPIDRLCALVTDPLVAALVRIEQGRRLDLYPRDVAGLPVPRAWLEAPETPLAEAWELDAEAVRRLLGA